MISRKENAKLMQTVEQTYAIKHRVQLVLQETPRRRDNPLLLHQVHLLIGITHLNITDISCILHYMNLNINQVEP